MPEKVPQSREDLEKHLSNTLYFIESSSSSFDRGFEQEAKRLATSVRVLVHDTRSSHSLLKQLDKKGIKFYDSCRPEHEESVVYHGLIGRFLGQSSKNIVPNLDVDTPQLTDFDTWWNGCVIRDNQGNRFSRKDLILAVADQDGGAHVDPTLNKQYAQLSRENTLGWMSQKSGGNWEQDKGPESATVRQIAHELLKTLNPGYKLSTSDVERGSGIIVGEMTLHTTPAHPIAETEKVGRNDPCPCGSKKKYKKCCGY